MMHVRSSTCLHLCKVIASHRLLEILVISASRRSYCLPIGAQGLGTIPRRQILNRHHVNVGNIVDYSTGQSSITPFLLADIGEGITEVQILQWLVKEGDDVSEFDKIANVQSDKATVEITSPYDGKIMKLYGQAGTMVQVGKPLADIMISCAAPNSTEKAEIKPEEKGKITLATPSVRGAAKEMNIELESITGTGPNGRIMKQDLNIQKPQTAGHTRRVEMTMFQRGMLKSMEESMKIPHFTYSEMVIMDSAIRMRKALQQETRASKFSYMPFWIKVTSIALKDYPLLNASIICKNGQDSTSTVIEYHDTHNIAIAMDTPQGLAVPVISRVQEKSIEEIASELEILMEKGRTNALTKQDMANGTFSLSNIGSIGAGFAATPVILPNQVCIGAICKIQKSMIVDDGEPTGTNQLGRIASTMTVSWSADHRLIDGATLARFSLRWKNLVENPLLMLTHMK